jgi:hypothetical protein
MYTVQVGSGQPRKACMTSRIDQDYSLLPLVAVVLVFRVKKLKKNIIKKLIFMVHN